MIIRKLYLSIILSFILNLQVVGQEESLLRNAMKISPIELGDSEFQMTYERNFNERKSAILIMPSVILKEESNQEKRGLELMLQYRFFLTHLNKGKNKTLGLAHIIFFAGPYIHAAIYSEDRIETYYSDIDFSATTREFHKEAEAIEGGVLIGTSFFVTRRIIIDIYIGGGIRYADASDEYDEFRNYYDDRSVFDKGYTGVKPAVGLQLGFAF